MDWRNLKTVRVKFGVRFKGRGCWTAAERGLVQSQILETLLTSDESCGIYLGSEKIALVWGTERYAMNFSISGKAGRQGGAPHSHLTFLSRSPLASMLSPLTAAGTPPSTVATPS